MDFDTFKKAVDSYKGFKGYVSIMGGEPTLHPECDRFLEYLQQVIPERKYYRPFVMPVQDFYNCSRTLKYSRGRKRTFFTALGPGYYKHFETIQDVIPYQQINDHTFDDEHQAIMVTRKELGFSDEEWIKLRDNCWIQNLWSSSITPKGAFFCEVAASLDMLFNGPGGWPIEEGWWKRKPEDFKDQLHWCELCSVALPVPIINAAAGKDIISPVMFEKLKAVGSPKVADGRYVLLDPTKYKREDYSLDKMTRSKWYIPEENEYRLRVSPTNESLRPRDIKVFFADGSVLTDKPEGLDCLSREEFESLAFKDWVLVFKSPADLNTEFIQSLKKCTMNPGCLYFYTPSLWRRLSLNPASIVKHARIMVFNRRAKALRGLTSLTLSEDMAARFPKIKRYAFTHYPLVGTIGIYEWLMIMKAIFINRAAFLNPFSGKY